MKGLLNTYGLESEEVKDGAVDDKGKSAADETEVVKSIDETHEEVEISKKDLEVVEDIEEGLESIKELLVASIENGGLSEREVTLTKLVTASFAARLEVDSDMVASFESFDGEEIDRVEATKVALESISKACDKVIAIRSLFVKKEEPAE